ncbi:DUF134 domain-containing protein [Clostridium sp. MT-14]|uniref:UPF0251 protein LN736_05130 n=1 Tax=Clostridium aromativorans TaxID=2836848 RepID=A0ABS8N518_9CLOT|nr:DUF134 domain-containing protein [Clostridium aromativorans]MCC9294254.1 DUF134 domain-containing protein [Clostridium aromativorans]
MPRPTKCRQICCLPEKQNFGPLSSSKDIIETIHMTVDEFETIRLIDLERLTQIQCARQMKIARTTVQSIYSSARTKLAECIVKGKELHINGGNYILCSDSTKKCRCIHCPKKLCNR